MQFNILVAMVKPNFTDAIIEAMKAKGVGGATIIPARGTGAHEAKTFFGLSIEEQTDILLFVVEHHAVDGFMEVMNRVGRFNEPSTGFAFSLAIEQLIGLGKDQMELFKKQAGNK